MQVSAQAVNRAKKMSEHQREGTSLCGNCGRYYEGDQCVVCLWPHEEEHQPDYCAHCSRYFKFSPVPRPHLLLPKSKEEEKREKEEEKKEKEREKKAELAREKGYKAIAEAKKEKLAAEKLKKKEAKELADFEKWEKEQYEKVARRLEKELEEEELEVEAQKEREKELQAKGTKKSWSCASCLFVNDQPLSSCAVCGAVSR